MKLFDDEDFYEDGLLILGLAFLLIFLIGIADGCTTGKRSLEIKNSPYGDIKYDSETESKNRNN